MVAADPGAEAGHGELLRGAVVQRADAGDRRIVLKVRAPGKTTFVLGVAGKGVGLSDGRPPKPPGARSLRSLEGFRIAWIGRREVGLEKGEGRARVDVGGRSAGDRVEVKSGADAWESAPADQARAPDLEAWLARGAALAEDWARSDLAARRTDALRAVKRGVARVTRRVEAIRGDLARIGDAEEIAQRAQWLLAEASRAPRGARSLKVTDWSSGEPKTIEVALDPAKPARAQVEAMFQRARRLKLGAKVAGERLAQAESAIAALEPVEARIRDAETVAAIESAIAEARAAAPKDVKLESAAGSSGTTKNRQARSLPYRPFRSRSGATILVGRGAAQNDVLTFQIARPHDLWLHAKGYPGAHVIVRLAKNHACPGDVLADAAQLAAHFSDARGEAVVDVQYVARRYLRKPRGSAPGFVVVERERVLALRADADVLRGLLESEEAAGAED